METQPFITLDHTTVRLRDRLFLQDTLWQMNPGENWAILGPNGSGKTTFVKSLFGAVPVVSGRIVYNFGKEGRRNQAAVTDAIGYVAPELHRDIIEREDLEDDFREFSGNINEITTVKDIILNKWVESEDGTQAEKRLNAIAKKIGIETLLERNIRSLSTGEMNTALIAKALIKRPKLLILDEPFDGLDEPSCNALALSLIHI